jgi:Fe(3+) dicitrate transport protein
MAKGDGSGEAQFKQLLRGRYQLSVTGEGVAALTREIDLAGDENAKLELVLEPVAIAEERAVNGLRIADTPETIERIPGSIAIIDEKTFETSRVFTFTEALRLTARGILPSSPRLAQGGLKFRF